MTFLFLICAVVGGTVLFCQLILTLFGLAGDTMDFDTSAEVGHDFSADLHVDGAGVDHDGSAGHAEHDHGHIGSTWLFSVISFRTVVAAVTFFGLAGLAAQSAEASPPMALVVALAAGAAAMYSVYWMMQMLVRLRAEGTVRIERAVGHEATVYLTIPGHAAGAGKVHINLQNRTMEYQAITSGETIPTGAKVVVVNVVASDTLEVQPALEPERIEHV